MGRNRSRKRVKLLREGRIRGVTIPVKKMTQAQMLVGRLAHPAFENEPMPRTRAECSDVPRPCPFVRCKYNLYLDVDVRTGSIKFNHPDKEPGEMDQSCALDVAERYPRTLEEVGLLMNITRERVRQIENDAGRRLRKNQEAKRMQTEAVEMEQERYHTVNHSFVPSRFKA